MTKKQSAIDKNYKLRVTPEESEAVQKVCFENGIYWAAGQKNVINTHKHFLSIRAKDKYIFHNDSENSFSSYNFTKISPKDFIKKFRKSEPKWEKHPAKYQRGDDWYTEDTVFFQGVEMGIDNFLKFVRASKSLEASHRRNFPKK